MDRVAKSLLRVNVLGLISLLRLSVLDFLEHLH